MVEQLRHARHVRPPPSPPPRLLGAQETPSLLAYMLGCARILPPSVGFW